MTITDNAIAAVAEPTRRRLLTLLREHEEATVTLLVELTGLNQPMVSKHLKVLATASMVAVRPEGRRRHYRLEPDGFRAINAWLQDFAPLWQARFDALDALVSTDPDGSAVSTNTTSKDPR